MIFNPFKPKEVKLSNYHPEQIEQNKLHDVMEKTQIANGRIGEFQAGYQEKSYSDVIKRPLSYGDVIKRPESYGDVIKRPESYGDVIKPHDSYSDAMNNNIDRSMELERIRNQNKTPNNFNGFKDN